MRQFLFFVFFLLFFSHSYSAFGQESQENYYIADEFLEDEDWNQAIQVYKEMLYDDSENAELNFRLGFCYLNTPFDKKKAIYYFKKAASHYSRRRRAKNQPPIETFFYLAKAYEVNYQFEKAIEQLNFLLNRVRGVDRNFKNIIEKEIQQATYGIGYFLNPIDCKIVDSFPCLNSNYSDYSPVVSANDSVFFFTSKRLSNMGDDTYASGQKMEDIYMAVKKKGRCDTAINVGSDFNTVHNDAVVGISPDGKTLFIYRDEGDGDLYQSKFISGKWTIPEKLPNSINSPARETSATISADGKMLFFTSDRKKGYGGLDIYVSHKLPSGEWGEPENMGPSVNSSYDEESPYLFPDEKTLFFASKGHYSMGGYDLFYINLDRTGKWPGAVNLGYPINTPEDDMFIMPLVDGKTFYIASKSIDGKKHWSNIYKIEIPFIETMPVTMFNGRVELCEGTLPKVRVDVYNSKTKEHYITTYSDIVNGNFSFYYPSSKPMSVRITIGSTLLYADTIAPVNKTRNLSKIIKLRSSSPCDSALETSGAQLGSGILNNGEFYDKAINIDPIFFNTGESNFKNVNGLPKLIGFLKKHKNTIIEVGAYADSKGPALYNEHLTELRASNFKKYLISQNVSNFQIISKGYGESSPIAKEYINKRYLRRGAQFNRRLEIRVLQQSDVKLLIVQKFNVPEELKI